MKIGRGVSELWRVENLPLPLTWPMAYTTACITVQAVISYKLRYIKSIAAGMKTRVSIEEPVKQCASSYGFSVKVRVSLVLVVLKFFS